LEALPPDRILQTEARILASDLGARNAPGGRALGIVEDGITLVEHPLETFRRGVCRDKPIVLGSTRDESRMWFALGVMTIPDSKDVLAAEMERFFQGKANAIFASYHARYPDADLAQLREQFLTDAVYRLHRTCACGFRGCGLSVLVRLEARRRPGPFRSRARFRRTLRMGRGAVGHAAAHGRITRCGDGGATNVRRARRLCTQSRPWLADRRSPSPLSKIFGGDKEIAALDDFLLTTFEGADRR
jgi:hypothetical protein